MMKMQGKYICADPVELYKIVNLLDDQNLGSDQNEAKFKDPLSDKEYQTDRHVLKLSRKLSEQHAF